MTSYLLELLGESFGALGTDNCSAMLNIFGSGFEAGSGYGRVVYGSVAQYGDLFVCVIEVEAGQLNIEFIDLTENSEYSYVQIPSTQQSSIYHIVLTECLCQLSTLLVKVTQQLYWPILHKVCCHCINDCD